MIAVIRHIFTICETVQHARYWPTAEVYSLIFTAAKRSLATICTKSERGVQALSVSSRLNLYNLVPCASGFGEQFQSYSGIRGDIELAGCAAAATRSSCAVRDT